MGQYVNPGNESFASAVLYSQIYVDKTGMLEYLNQVMNSEQRYICVSRPRRFGKSIAARMAAAYYSRGCDSSQLFAGYKIARMENYQEQMNQHNVIHLDVAELRVTMPKGEELVGYLQKCVLEELWELFPKLVGEKACSLPLALADINEKTGERFVIIIDEWDAIFREEPNNQKAQDAYIDLLRGLFKGEKSHRFVNLAYLTGILPVKKYNNESALNNFDEFTMLHPEPLTEYVGFTEAEVQGLCERYQMDFGEAKRWYDGYSFEGMQHIYSPNSVVKAMLRRKYNSYWTGTVAYESLKLYITMNQDGLQEAVLRLLLGERCRVDVDTFENDMTRIHSRDDVLTILIHLGYLSYDVDAEEAYIPNEEVHKAFSRAVQGTDWTPVIQAIQASDQLLRATWNQDAEAVAAGVEEVHAANTSVLKYNDENSLACVIRLAYYNAVNEYTVVNEMPSGKGFADITFIPRPFSDKPAMIVELKYNGSADAALEQIEERRYADALKAYKGRMLLVGICYDRESKKHTCRIKELDK